MSTTIQPGGGVTSASILRQPAEATLVQIELLLARDLDVQIREMGDRIRFMGTIRREYLKNIGEITSFLAKNSNTSREDSKRYIEASMAELADLFDNFMTYDPDSKSGKLEPKPLTLGDNGDKQTAVDVDGEGSSFASWGDFFAEGALITDPEKARQHAEKLSDDDGELPFYFGHTNNTFSDGSPKIAVFVEPLEKFVEVMRGKMSEVGQESETLAVELNRLTEQRKAALEAAYRMLSQIDQTKAHALKGGA